MAKAIQQKKEEKLTLQQHISSFLTKNRTIIIGAIAAVFVVIGALIAVTVVSDGKRDAAYTKIDALVEQWNAARADKADSLASAEDAIIADLDKIAASNGRSFAGVRANMALAEIYFTRKDWTNAQAKYLAAEKSDPEAYTAGLNLFNAAVCAEELGNQEEAIAYLEKAVTLDSFPMKTRALFNVGRIEETLGQADRASATYEKLTGDYAEDDWTKLAKSRLIALSIK